MSTEQRNIVGYVKTEKRKLSAKQRCAIWLSGVKEAIAEIPPTHQTVWVDCDKDDEFSLLLVMDSTPIKYRLKDAENETSLHRS